MRGTTSGDETLTPTADNESTNDKVGKDLDDTGGDDADELVGILDDIFDCGLEHREANGDAKRETRACGG